jgi:hypothetical protein
VVYRGGVNARRFATILICDDVEVTEMMSGIHDGSTCRCARGSCPDSSESDVRGMRYGSKGSAKMYETKAEKDWANNSEEVGKLESGRCKSFTR